MITKASIFERAEDLELRPTTVEKDYVLGWLLAGVAEHPDLSKWVFKGGTCLKKCFFETYRFSEDLDFTVPMEQRLTVESIKGNLAEATAWVTERSGIQFPSEKFKIERYLNPRGRESFQARIPYACRLNLAPNSLQRVKFDITQDELLGAPPEVRDVFHSFEDAPDPPAGVLCYTVDEILAEKTRALFERQGRARDVYDLVHLSRDFRSEIEPERARQLLRAKFSFKELPPPSLESILGRIDHDQLRVNWDGQLAHQVPLLPPLQSFLEDLRDAIAWWLEPARAEPQRQPVASKTGEEPIPRRRFPRIREHVDSGAARRRPHAMQPLERLRFAARNRLCVEVEYRGVRRLIEPYSLRSRELGAPLLYAYERLREGRPSESIKSFAIDGLRVVSVTQQSFRPRYMVEL